MVGRMHQLYSSYHPAVWWMISATAVTKITQFMVFPFIALYMSYHTHASPGVIGLAVGMGALTSTAFGFIGGSLADKFGRKWMMAISMLLSAVLMAVFPNIHAISLFFVLSGLNGIVRTMFQPASQAMLSDLTPVDKRGSVFAMDYWAINVGAAIGPILGGYFGTVATGWTFYLTAVVDLVYAIAIFVVLPESKPQQSTQIRAVPAESGGGEGKAKRTPEEQVTADKATSEKATAEKAIVDKKIADEATGRQAFSFRAALRTVAADKAFLVFLAAGMLGGIGYAQIETTLPQVMGQAMSATKAAQMFSFVLASNALEVVLLQVFIAKISARLGIVRALMVGQALFALGYAGISVSHVLWQYVGAMFVLTLGEIINFPIMSQYTSLLADEDLRGTYFGASSIGGLSFFIGPWLGGVILHASNGTVLFLVAAGISFLATPLYGIAESLRHKSSKFRKNSGSITT